MALSLHTTKIYKVEYGRNAINGWDEVEKFLQFLRSKMGTEIDDGIFINEEETEVEIPFSTLRKMEKDEVWGTTASLILEEADKDNDYAFLTIW